MKIAMSNIWTVEKLVTRQTFEELRKRKNLVKYILPAHIFLLFQKEVKFLYVKRSINNMFYNYASFIINENLFLEGFRTNEMFLLINGEECIAIETLLK
jgi:hypothetical protein